MKKKKKQYEPKLDIEKHYVTYNGKHMDYGDVGSLKFLSFFPDIL